MYMPEEYSIIFLTEMLDPNNLHESRLHPIVKRLSPIRSHPDRSNFALTIQICMGSGATRLQNGMRTGDNLFAIGCLAYLAIDSLFHRSK